MARFTIRHFASTALAAAMFAAVAAPSFAQPAPAQTPAATAAPADAKPHHGPRHERKARPTPEQREQWMAKRAAQMKQKLQITSDQEPAWTTFQSSMKPQEPKLSHLSRAEMEKLTTPERIDRMRAMHAERSAQMDRRAEAVKTFYATLKPEQQKVFDKEGAHFMHRDGQHHARGDGRGDHRGHAGEGRKHQRPHGEQRGPKGADAPTAPAPAAAQ